MLRAARLEFLRGDDFARYAFGLPVFWCGSQHSSNGFEQGILVAPENYRVIPLAKLDGFVLNSVVVPARLQRFL